jgi:hypothetical protein
MISAPPTSIARSSRGRTIANGAPLLLSNDLTSTPVYHSALAKKGGALPILRIGPPIADASRGHPVFDRFAVACPTRQPLRPSINRMNRG